MGPCRNVEIVEELAAKPGPNRNRPESRACQGKEREAGEVKARASVKGFPCHVQGSAWPDSVGRREPWRVLCWELE